MRYQRIISFLPAAFIFLALPFIRWQQLPDPDFLPRHFAMALSLAMVLALSFRSAVKSSGGPVAVAPPFLFAILFLSWLLIRTSLNGPAVAEWMRWATGAVVVALLVRCFRVFPELLRLLPRLAACNVLIMAGSFLLQVAQGAAVAWTVAYDHGGWAGNKNFLSELLLLSSVFLFPGWKEPHGGWRVFIRAAVLLSCVLLLWLQTMAVWLAVIVLCIVSAAGWLKQRYISGLRWRHGVGALVLVLLIGLFFIRSVPPVRQRLDRIVHYLQVPVDPESADPKNDNSVYERFLMWRNSIAIIKGHPVAGCGLTQWKIEQSAYPVGGTRHLNTGLVRFEHPHNEYLLLAAETGVVGLVLFLLLFVSLFVSCRSEDPTSRWSRRGLLAAGVVSLFAYPLSRDLTWYLFLSHVAVVAAHSNRPLKKRVLPAAVLWTLALVVASTYSLICGSMISSERLLGQSIAASLKLEHGRAKREAVKAKTRWYRADRTGTPMEWYIGDAAFRGGEIEEAVRHLEQARREHPFHPRVLNDLGTAYEQSGRPDSAIVCYRSALRYCPGLNEAKLNLAATCFNAGYPEEAYTALRSIREPDALKGKELKNYREFLPVIEEAVEPKQ